MPWWITIVQAVLSPASALGGVWIGQRIARDTAKKQWLRDQRLKIYSDILRAINEYSVWLIDASEGAKFPQLGRESESTLDKHNKQIAGEFHAAYAVAPLFVGDASLRLLERAKPVLYYHSDPLANFEVKDLDEKIATLKRIREELVISAKLDF
jgi:hypothetical protein